MTIKHEFIYKFSGFSNVESRCHIRVLDEADKRLVVLCSQMAKDPGTSVTNAAELIAQNVKVFLEKDNVTLISAIERYIRTSRFTKMLDDLVRSLKEAKNLTVFALESVKLALEYREQQRGRTGKTSNLLWVEHYAAGIGLSASGSYAVVEFEGESWTPNWQYMSLADLAAKTGYDKAAFEVPLSALGD